MRGNSFGIIFADLRMPGLDGPGLYRLASELSASLAKKMVFVTGGTASSSAREFPLMTGNPVLSKPFNISDVRQLIDTIT